MRLFTPIHIIVLCTVLRLTTSFCGFNRFRILSNITKRRFLHTNTTKTSEVYPVEEILHRSYVHM